VPQVTGLPRNCQFLIACQGGREKFAPRAFAAKQTAPASVGILPAWESDFIGRLIMKWAGMYLLGFVVLIGGLLAALWKLGILERIGTAWTLIGVAILIGIGIMISVTNSGRKDNIEIDSK
jgi:hypothetical protein